MQVYRDTYNAEPATTTQANQPQQPAPAVDCEALVDFLNFWKNEGTLVQAVLSTKKSENEATLVTN